MEEWSSKLLQWYEDNKRDLPWRSTSDPYKIWLSEIILQQTRVNQGTAYYLRFVEKYPTITELATASEDEVLKVWQGLGYYSRARNLHQAAKAIRHSFKGLFPRKYEDIRGLKGVGPYTAAAIASFAYNLPYAVLDGNVMRVYSRLFGITDPIESMKGRKKLQHLADELLPKENSASYNQAAIELGALVCLPKNPHCTDCPLQIHCEAFAHKLTNKLPVKQLKAIKKVRFLNYLVIQSGQRVVIRKRSHNDIWKGLYDFPCIETTASASLQQLAEKSEWINTFGKNKVAIQSVSGEYKHLLTHRKLLVTFIKLILDKPIKPMPEGCEWINLRKLHLYAVPRVIDRYISTNL